MPDKVKSVYQALSGSTRVLVLRWPDGCAVAFVDRAKFVAGESETAAVAAAVRESGR